MGIVIPYSQLNTDLSLYTSFNTRARVVIANRVGWGKTFGQYEFYQAQFLGLMENLRGYRKFRFAGDESAFIIISMCAYTAVWRIFQELFFSPAVSASFLFNHDVGSVSG